MLIFKNYKLENRLVNKKTEILGDNFNNKYLKSTLK